MKKIPENVVWSPNYCYLLGNRSRWICWRCQNFDRKLRNSRFLLTRSKYNNGQKCPPNAKIIVVVESIWEIAEVLKWHYRSRNLIPVRLARRRAALELQWFAIATFSSFSSFSWFVIDSVWPSAGLVLLFYCSASILCITLHVPSQEKKTCSSRYLSWCLSCRWTSCKRCLHCDRLTCDQNSFVADPAIAFIIHISHLL